MSELGQHLLSNELIKQFKQNLVVQENYFIKQKDKIQSQIHKGGLAKQFKLLRTQSIHERINNMVNKEEAKLDNFNKEQENQKFRVLEFKNSKRKTISCHQIPNIKQTQRQSSIFQWKDNKQKDIVGNLNKSTSNNFEITSLVERSQDYVHQMRDKKSLSHHNKRSTQVEFDLDLQNKKNSVFLTQYQDILEKINSNDKKYSLNKFQNVVELLIRENVQRKTMQRYIDDRKVSILKRQLGMSATNFYRNKEKIQPIDVIQLFHSSMDVKEEDELRELIQKKAQENKKPKEDFGKQLQDQLQKYIAINFKIQDKTNDKLIPFLKDNASRNKFYITKYKKVFGYNLDIKRENNRPSVVVQESPKQIRKNRSSVSVSTKQENPLSKNVSQRDLINLNKIRSQSIPDFDLKEIKEKFTDLFSELIKNLPDPQAENDFLLKAMS